MSSAPNWSRAACRDADPALFFPDHGGDWAYADARAICQGCPVRTECLDDVMAAEGSVSTGYRHGMRGGLTPVERLARYRASTRAGTSSAATVQGTRLDEIARLLAAGEAPEMVARRMSSSVSALSRYAYSANAPEIGRVFNHADRVLRPEYYHLKVRRMSAARRLKRVPA